MSSDRDSPRLWAPDTHAGQSVPWAWVSLLVVYNAATHQMDERLRSRHRLTLRDYEVLLFLSWAPGRRMRPVDLAQRTLVTQGGITRLLEGLERAGHVVRERSDSDRRVSYAKLTPAGSKRLRQAAKTHVADIRSLFSDHFTEEELLTLTGLLDRLPAARFEPGGKRPGLEVAPDLSVLVRAKDEQAAR